MVIVIRYFTSHWLCRHYKLSNHIMKHKITIRHCIFILNTQNNEISLPILVMCLSVILTDGIYDLEGAKENGSRRER